MNKPSTCIDSGTKLTQPRSGPVRQPVRFRLIDRDGRICGTFRCASQATLEAERLWPDQEQDEDRTGLGWDVQVVGLKT